MNELSLAHSYEENQPSWKDDPFNLGVNYVKEMTSMSHETRFINYTSELVYQHAIHVDGHYELTIDMLSIEEKNKLSRLYIELTDREVSECIFGDDFTINNDFTCAILFLLKENTEINREKLAKIICKNILIYYKDTLNDLLSDACERFFRTEMTELGYQSYEDRDSGDIIWSKF
jgi:hypothetical protein